MQYRVPDYSTQKNERLFPRSASKIISRSLFSFNVILKIHIHEISVYCEIGEYVLLLNHRISFFLYNS